jgi:CxxC motif-containing protein (DUF1111 family)
MNSPLKKTSLLLASAVAFYSLMNGLPSSIQIDLKNGLEWDSELGHRYQVETSTDGFSWASIGSERSGTNSKLSHALDSAPSGALYRIRETIPGIEAPNTTVPNSDFEIGSLSNWSKGGTHQPSRSSAQSKNGTYSARFYLPGGGNESLLYSNRITGLQGGESYTLSFWGKKAQSGPSLLLQYRVQWFGTSNGDTGLKDFSLGNNTWQKVSIPNLTAPAGATEAVVTFRIVTGAVGGAKGEIFIDTLEFSNGVVSTPEQITSYVLNAQKIAEIRIPTTEGVEYSVMESTNLDTWGNTDISFTGTGSPRTVTVPAESLSKFVRVLRPEYDLFAPSEAHASLSLQANSLAISWSPSPTPTVQGYRIYYGTDMGNLDQSVEVARTISSTTIDGLSPGLAYYFAVVAFEGNSETSKEATLFSATNNQTVTLVALNDASTILEPETTIDHEEALITYIADRGRDRHAREGAVTAAQYPLNNFNRYDFYLKDYWVGRYYAIEIIDRIAKGGSSITLNITTSHALESKDTRLIYLGETTPAQYAFNFGEDGHRDFDLNFINDLDQLNQFYEINPLLIEEQGPQFPKKGYGEFYYSATLPSNYQGRNLKIGDRIEIEFSPFLLNDINYYGTAFLYIIGEGIVPWHGVGNKFDSYPLPEATLLGGYTTQHQRFTNTQYHSFKQMAGNLSPINSERFMLGRRIHHTNFQTGVHSEQPNDDFIALRNKLGPNYINHSCIACHTNNGKGMLPSSLNQKMSNSVTKIGRDALGNYHETLGGVLQLESLNGTPEGIVSISNWIEEEHAYDVNSVDSPKYNLRHPQYNVPEGIDYFSVRLAPHIWGTGLLEAIDEETILNLQDPQDLNNDGISGRANFVTDSQGNYRLGRFGYKASKYSLKQHIASALNTDMGVTTSIFPSIDNGPIEDSVPEISDKELDQLYRYIALLGLTPQRNYEDSNVIEGEQLFNSINCSACHISHITTSEFHPLTELRSQKIRPFTDLLLHDMGEGLADNIGEENASGSEWRTTPLWGIGLTEEVGEGTQTYLHDGRARSLEEAILWHGGEAEQSKESFRTLSESDREKLLDFLRSL